MTSPLEASRIPRGDAPSQSFFRDKVYAQATKAPWDIGRAQPALRRVQDVFRGAVLDVGCGLGDNAIWVASLNGVTRVLGADFAPVAVAEAKKRAQRAPVDARNKISFVVGDVFNPSSFGAAPGTFDVLLDSACFHCIGDDNAQRHYLAAVTSLVKRGGRAAMLNFSDENAAEGWVGPRRISASHTRAMWEEAGWRVDHLADDARLEDNMRRHGGLGGFALLMTATRT